MNLYRSVSESELVTEPVPANTKSDDIPVVKERFRCISSPAAKIQGFCVREALGTV